MTDSVPHRPDSDEDVGGDPSFPSPSKPKKMSKRSSRVNPVLRDVFTPEALGGSPGASSETQDRISDGEESQPGDDMNTPNSQSSARPSRNSRKPARKPKKPVGKSKAVRRRRSESSALSDRILHGNANEQSQSPAIDVEESQQGDSGDQPVSGPSTFPGCYGATATQYPYQSLEELAAQSEREVGQKPEYPLATLARSALLDDFGAGTSATVEQILSAICDKFPYYNMLQTKFVVNLREALRSHPCFVLQWREKGKRNLYTCDPTIDPKTNITSKRGLTKFPTSARKRTPTAGPPRSLPLFELVTSEVFEAKDPHRKEVFYCAYCGPILVRRRRSDGCFLATLLLDLIKLVVGRGHTSPALEELRELVIDAQIAHQLVKSATQRRAVQTFVSLDLVRQVAIECNLSAPLAGLLDPNLPSLPDDEELTRPWPRDFNPRLVTCRYCQSRFSASALEQHHSQYAGICQVDEPEKLSMYLRLLDESSADARKRLGFGADDEDAYDAIANTVKLRKKGTFKDLYDVEPPELRGSSVPPSLLYWSPEEKERFFYALSRHSRLRPDLIAEHIGTKTASEVWAYLSFLEQSASSLDDNAKEPIPAARVQTDSWIAQEEKLAEDAVVWEAFTSQAARTPHAYRDTAQMAVMADELQPACMACPRGTCDGAWPACGRCLEKDFVCEWSQEYHPDALGRHLPEKIKYSIRHRLLATQSIGGDMSYLDSIRQGVSQSLSWHQLIALGQQRPVDELNQGMRGKWERYLTRSASEKPASLRRQISDILMANGLGYIPPANKEAIYNTLYYETTKDDSNPGSLVDDVLRVAANVAEQFKRREVQKNNVDQDAASKWAEIPLAVCTAEDLLKNDSLEGIKEEVHQARKQLSAAGMSRDDLGEAGAMFELGNLGILADLYRRDSKGDTGIALDTLEDLYTLLRTYTTALVSATLSMAQVRHRVADGKKNIEPDTVRDAARIVSEHFPSKYQSLSELYDSMLGPGKPAKTRQTEEAESKQQDMAHVFGASAGTWPDPAYAEEIAEAFDLDIPDQWRSLPLDSHDPDIRKGPLSNGDDRIDTDGSGSSDDESSLLDDEDEEEEYARVLEEERLQDEKDMMEDLICADKLRDIFDVTKADEDKGEEELDAEGRLSEGDEPESYVDDEAGSDEDDQAEKQPLLGSEEDEAQGASVDGTISHSILGDSDSDGDPFQEDQLLSAPVQVDAGSKKRKREMRSESQAPRIRQSHGGYRTKEFISSSDEADL